MGSMEPFKPFWTNEGLRIGGPSVWNGCLLSCCTGSEVAAWRSLEVFLNSLHLTNNSFSSSFQVFVVFSVNIFIDTIAWNQAEAI